jgi:manganese/iron transport system permease protein
VQTLAEPFLEADALRSLGVLLLLSVVAGVLGGFVVMRRLAFATHALGVATFPGAVLAAELGLSVFAGGLIAAGLLALVLALLLRSSDLDAAAATGLVLVAAIAVGSLLVSGLVDPEETVEALLFGRLEGATAGQLIGSAALAAGALLAAAAFWRGWLVVAFDRSSAAGFGFSPGLHDAALFLLLAVTVVVASSAVGSLLVSSLLVVPAACVRAYARRPVRFAVGTGLLAAAVSFTGFMISHHAATPPGATIAAVAAVVFAMAVAGRELRVRREAVPGLAS